MNMKKGVLALTVVVPMLGSAAHAGYDSDSGMAMGSRSSNSGSNMGMTSRTTTRTTVRYSPTVRYRTTRYTRNVTTTTMVNGMTMVTTTGRLVSDANNKSFEIVDTLGRTYTVSTIEFGGAEMANKLQEGQVVRVNGQFRDGTLYARNLRVLSMAGTTYAATGSRVYYAPYYYTVGANQVVSGTLVEDADDNEFEVRDSMGRVYMIRTRNIADSYGLNKLQEGQRVRVYGYWFVGDNKPQIEASNVTVLR